MLATTTGPSQSRELLPREFHDAVVELSLCVHKRAIYPATHPILHGAVEGLLSRLDSVFESEPSVSVGIANRRLLIEGHTTEAGHPLLSELADLLHQHQLGAIRIERGVTRDEIDGLISTVCVSTRRGGQPFGLQPREEQTRWPHVAIYPIAFDRLELLGSEGDDGVDASSRAGELWIALARAALAGESSQDALLDPSKIAASIDGRTDDSGYDQVVFGCLSQLVTEIDAQGEQAAPSVSRRVSQLIESLSEKGLSRLLSLGIDTGQGRQLLTGAASHLSGRAVLELVQAAVKHDGFATVSAGMLRMLNKMADVADKQSAGSLADGALRGIMHRLLRGFKLENPNPQQYDEVLYRASAQRSAGGPDRRRDRIEYERTLDLALETNTGGEFLDLALSRLAMRDGVAATVERIKGYRESPLRETLLDRLINEASLRELLNADRPDIELLGQTIERLKARAIGPLCDSMEARGDRDAALLGALFDRVGWDALSPLGERVPNLSASTLRQVVLFCDRLDAWPPQVDPMDLMRHKDATVRREVCRTLVKKDEYREAAVLVALRDPDEGTLAIGLMAVAGRCPIDAARIIMRRSQDASLADPWRARLVRTAGSSSNPEVLAWLIGLSTSKSWITGRLKLRKSSPEVLSALAALGRYHADAPGVPRIMTLASQSRAADIRGTVRWRDDNEGDV